MLLIRGWITMMSELVRWSYVSVKSPSLLQETPAQACMYTGNHIHPQANLPTHVLILYHKHLPSHLHMGFPFWSLTQWALSSCSPTSYSLNKSISRSHTLSLCVSQWGLSELAVFCCCWLPELRLVHRACELPSSETLGLAQIKLPFSLWGSLAGGAATSRLSCMCMCAHVC